MGKKNKLRKKKKGASKPLINAHWSIGRNTWILLAGILLITFFAFTRSLSNEFTSWDDEQYVTQNFDIRSINSETVEKMFTEPMAFNYHPLTMLSLAVNYKFYELNPTSYFAVNIILHVLNTMLVFFFVFYVTRGKHEIALFAALFFGVHPMHVESVSWISERKDVLYTFFFLGGLIAIVRYIQLRKEWLLWSSVVLAALAMLSKPAAIIFPLLVLLLFYFLRGRLTTKHFIKSVPFWLLSTFFAYMTLEAQTQDTAVVGEFEGYNLLERLVIACYGWVMYIAKMIVPAKLSAFYPYPGEEGQLPTYFYLFPLLVAATFYGAWRIMKKTKVVLFGLLFYSINLLLVLQVVSIGKAIIADRYTYVPYIGLFVIFGYGIYEILTRRKYSKLIRQSVLAAVVISGVAFAYITYERTAVWNNNETLWTDVIKKYPGESIGWNSRGNYYKERGDVSRALADYNAAIQNDGSSHFPFVNRGTIYQSQGKYQEAIEDYTTALNMAPGEAKAWYNRANTYYSMGNTSQALKDVNMAMQYSQMFEAYFLRGLIHTRKGDVLQAISDYSRSIQLNPYYPSLYTNRGSLYFQTGQYQEAVQDYSTVIQLQPNNAAHYRNRAKAYQALGNNRSATKDQERAIQLGG